MRQLNSKLHSRAERKVKILQFGEGNFLRAFVDYTVQKMCDCGVYNGAVAVVQPLPQGRVAELAVQDGLYTLFLEGFENGSAHSSKQIIDVLEDFINPYVQYDKFLDYAKSADLELIISNTTESGIALNADDTDLSLCPASFPAKLLAFLRARYMHFEGDMSKGLGIIPCELIDYNGDKLKEVLNELAVLCGLDEGFIAWLNNANHFTNTLVDRIVTGYPAARIAEIEAQNGYKDNSVVTGEVFMLWVLQQNSFIESRFPAHECGLNVVFAQDITPYKQQKVKILNGSHTALVPYAYLLGIDTVGEAVNNEECAQFLQGLIFDEICPTIDLPAQQTHAFASSVIERFKNPFIRHELMSIALNSTTKFCTRLLPTLIDYVRIKGKVPSNLCKAFGAFVLFHRGRRGSEQIRLNDNPQILKRWERAWSLGNAGQIMQEVCGWSDIWGMDLAKVHSEFLAQATNNLEYWMERCK